MAQGAGEAAIVAVLGCYVGFQAGLAEGVETGKETRLLELVLTQDAAEKTVAIPWFRCGHS